uniref:CHK domain-containing protein n=1 Tax=Rhabditophanes sp. KR3021 TaxID=114890 RepID=A0AC35TQH7_9BILA
MSWRDQLVYPDCKLNAGWVEEKVRKIYSNARWSDVEIESVSEEGFMAHLRRMVVTYENEDPLVPHNFLVKIPSYNVDWSDSDIQGGSECEDQCGAIIIANLTEAENDSYLILSEYKEKYDLEIPRIFAAIDTRNMAIDESPCLVMEEILDVHVVNVVDGMNLEQVKSVMAFIVKLQTLSIIEKPANPGVAYEKWEKMPVKFEEIILGMVRQAKRRFPDKLGPMAERIFEHLYKDMNCSMVKEQAVLGNDGLSVIAHNDLWTSNLLMDKHDKNKLKCVVDWQATSLGTPTDDLCHVLFACMSTENRRKYFKPLLKHLYEELVKSVSKHGEQIPFSYEEYIVGSVIY